MHLDYSEGDRVLVADPNDPFAAWNTEFHGTVKKIRMEAGSTVITVETPNGEHIEVDHDYISR